MNPPDQYYGESRTDAGILFQERVDSFTRGNAKAAFQQLRHALRHSEKSGDQNKIAWSLLNIAMVLRGQRQYSTAIQVLEKVRSIFTSINNEFGLASALEELSYANRELNRNALALEYSHRAVKMFQTLNRPLELAWAYDNMAVIYFNLSKRNESLTFAKKARAIFIEFNYQSCLAWNACNLGSLYFEMGFYFRAGRYYEEALKTFTGLKNKHGIAWSLLWLGMLSRAQCRFAQAETQLEKARKGFEELELKDRVGWCLLNQAAIKRTQGKDEEAILINKKSIQLFSPLKNNDGVAWSLFQIGQIFRDRGQLVKAWQTIREALNLHTDISNQKGMGWAEAEWGQTYMMLNDQSHARECFIRAKVTADQLDSLPMKAEIDKNLANFYLDEGLLQKGGELLEKSDALCRKIQAWEIESEVLLGRGRYALIVGDLKLARACIQEAGDLIDTYELLRLKPTAGLYLGELLVMEGKADEGVKVFEDVTLLSKKIQQRRLRAEALLGLVQAQRKQKTPSQLSLMLYYIEKDVRAISSRKLKAKFLVVKGLISYATNGFIDTRLFTQSLQIMDSTGLFVLKRQILGLLSDLYLKEGRGREWKEYQESIRELLEKNPIDLHIVHDRRESLDVLPVSLAS